MIIRKKRFSKLKLESQLKRKGRGVEKTIFSLIFLVILVLIVIGFLAFSNWQMNQKRQELSQRLESSEKEIEAFEKKNEELSAQISESQKESFLEKEARERFNLKKPGEEIVVILAPPEEKKEEVKEPKTFWQRILEKLKF